MNVIEDLENKKIKIDFLLTDVPYNIVGNQKDNKSQTDKSTLAKLKGINQIGSKKIIDGGNWSRVAEEWDIIEDYLTFTKTWLYAANNILKKDATVAICCGQYVLGDVLFVLNELNYKVLNIITWFKTNAPPNITCRTLTHSSEFIIWASKSGENWTFNYNQMKAYTCEDDFLKKANKQMRNVWFHQENLLPYSDLLIIPNNKRKEETQYGKHPTQKPERLFERIILMCTNENDIIFDPFAGSCTTAVVAKKLNRQFICCDINNTYVEIGRKRMVNCN